MMPAMDATHRCFPATAHLVACLSAVLLVSAAGEAQAQAPAASFSDLRRLVRPGDRLIVLDEQGVRTNAELEVVTSSLLVTSERRRWLRRNSKRRTFTEAEVTSVVRVDSRIEGAALGGLAGYTSIVWAACNTANQGNGQCLGATFLGGPVFGAIGAAIGSCIDLRHNRTIYLAAAPTARRPAVTLSPTHQRARVCGRAPRTILTARPPSA